MKLTPGRPGGDRRSPGGGGWRWGGGLIPGEVVGGVVRLTQRAPPPVVEGVLVWRQPVLVLDSWVSVRRQDLNTRAAWRLQNLPGKVLNLL